MLTFLRKIRKSLIESGSARNYILYGLGEILLVVVGILLALAINDWHNENLKRDAEFFTLTSLKEEFDETRKIIENYILSNQSIIGANHQLNEYKAINEAQFENRVFDSLFYNSAWNESLHLNQGVLSEIIYSGRLSSISDNALRRSLSSWSGRMEHTKLVDEDGLDYLLEKNNQYFDKKISWMKLSKYDRHEVSIKGSIEPQMDGKAFSRELELENFIYNQIWNAENKIRTAESLLELNLTILDQIQQAVEKMDN